MTPQRLHPLPGGELEDRFAAGLHDACSAHGAMLPSRAPTRPARKAQRMADRAQAHVLPNRKQEASLTGARGG